MFARIAEKFTAVIVVALSAVAMLLLLQRITTPGWAWLLTLVYALATSTWSISSQALWQHGPGELAIVGSLLALVHWLEHRASGLALWICGASAAGALIFRPSNIVLLPALFVALILARATVAQHARLWTLPLLGGCLIASYNLYVFRHLSGGYSTSLLKASFWAGIAGIFFSPGRGLLIYTPVALFAFAALLPGARQARQKHAPLLAACLVFAVLDVILLGKYRVWWGGYCWGSRMLIEIVPSLIILMAIGTSVIDRPWPRRAFAVLALYSVFTQAVGVFFYPQGRWDPGPPSVNAAPGRLWDWRDNPISRTVHAGPFWEPYAVVGAAITGGIPAARRRMRELNANPYDDSPAEGLP